MVERVIENWLDRASELSFQTPFCHMLCAEGHTVVHLTRHCGMELGKDVLSIAPDGTPCAYQLKGAGGGRITLKRWRDELNTQAIDLVAGKITHPSIQCKAHHRAYLVTNGTLDEEVIAAINALNTHWSDMGMNHLRLNTIVRGELLAKAESLENKLWPTELVDVRTLLEIYLHDGRGPIPKPKLATLFEHTLPFDLKEEKGPPSIEKCSRAIASAAVLCALASSGFSLEQNHVAEIEAWTLFAAYALALASKWTLPPKAWKPQVDIAFKRIHNTLVLLQEEVANHPTLVQGGITDRPFTEVRATLLAGLLCVLGFWPDEDSAKRDDSAIHQFCYQHRAEFKIWSEAAIPYVLATFWHWRRHDATAAVDFVLTDLIEFMCKRNGPESEDPVANVYYDVPDILPHLLGLGEEPIDETFRGRSYTLEGLVHLFVRRNWKQTMRLLWPGVTRIAFAEFRPELACDFFRWYSETGVNHSVYPKHTQSWLELTEAANENLGSSIPDVAKIYPHFILLFLLVCPHRISSGAMRWLDSQFS